jgi:hypothetical protein
MATTIDRTTDALPQPVGPEGLSEWSRNLREAVLADGGTFDERAIIMAESFRATEGEPKRQIRVAKAVAHLLATMPVRIREGERLVGWHPNTHVDETLAAEIAEANAYLGRQHWRGFVSEGHMAPDYPTACSQGLGGILRRIDDAEQALRADDPETPAKQHFYEAARIALGGLQQLIERYADLAGEMANEAEDRAWADDLREIEATCRRIAHEPPRTFREAIQLGWFMFLGVALENSTHHHCFGPGRLDQWLVALLRRRARRGHARRAACRRPARAASDQVQRVPGPLDERGDPRHRRPEARWVGCHERAFVPHSRTRRPGGDVLPRHRHLLALGHRRRVHAPGHRAAAQRQRAALDLQLRSDRQRPRAPRRPL